MMDNQSYDLPDESREELKAKFQALQRATALCEKHQPTGDGRAMCLVCAGQMLVAALSRIDYACGEPNEMGVSGYDVWPDEDMVVANVQKLAEKAAAAHEAGRREMLAEIYQLVDKMDPKTSFGDNWTAGKIDFAQDLLALLKEQT